MRLVFVLFVFFHGMIHTIGFVKAFQLAEINQLKLAISKPHGLLWLVSSVLFIAGALLIAFKQTWWWMPILLAVLLSQTVILFSWQDAKFGTIMNIIILVVSIAAVGAWQFQLQAKKDIQQFKEGVIVDRTSVITEQSLENLPSIVHKWLMQTGVVGREEIQTVYFKQKGHMKLKPDQKDWYSAEAEQYVKIEKPGFLWIVDMKMMPLVHVAGKDSFQNGEAKMLMKVGSILPVVSVSGNDKVDESSLQRYLLELALYPSAALQSYIDWEEINETTARAMMSYNGTSGAVDFHYKPNGELIKISAMRYKDSDERAEKIECIGEINEYKMIAGIKIPASIDISWMLEEERYTWYQLEIEDVQYNDW